MSFMNMAKVKNPERSKTKGRPVSINTICLLLLIFLIFLSVPANILAYYWPPSNIPPGPPPNYYEIDTTYFLGAPPLPYPPPDSGGIYIWYDQGQWNIANHIYSGGRSFEQFHCCVLVCMSEPPALGVNVFTEELELWADTTDKDCLNQNDRWGWKEWGDGVYEIWWDVTTRDWKDGEGDPNDFMKMIILGAAVDFNLWSSGHNGDIDENQIFLGFMKTPLSGVPGFFDFFSGVSDPYQYQAGSNPTGDPNTTIFTKHSDTLRSYNKNGLIDYSDYYSCYLAEQYGQRYAGTFAYEGNGVQFSTNGACQINNPPQIQLPPVDPSVFVCAEDTVCFDIFAWDPDPLDTITVEKLSGAGIYSPVTDTTPISDRHCFLPDTSGSYMFIFRVTDRSGLSDIDTTIVNVDINDPPTLTLPADTTYYFCAADRICRSGISASDPDPADTVVVQKISGPGVYDPSAGEVCFLPADVDSTYKFVFLATDSCGSTHKDSFYITVDVNEAPIISAPDTVEFNLCDTATVCFNITLYDPDDGLIVSVNPPGQFNSSDSSICFFADRDTTYDLTLIVTDTCGKSDTAYAVAIVDFNHPPVITAVDTVRYDLCDTATVCFDLTLHDPDDGLSVLVNPPGEYNPFDSSVCFFADRDTIYNFTIIATDTCGKSDTTQTVVVVHFNDPPTLTAPDTVKYDLCDTSTVCFDIVLYDPDDGLTVWVSPPGEFNPSDSSICFFADRDTTYDFTVTVTDTCGKSDTAYAVAVVDFNHPPVITAVDTIRYDLCDTATVCFDLTLHDPDDGLTVLVNPPGEYNPFDSSVCFFADRDTIYNFTIIATDTCGKSDTTQTVVVVNFNDPPTLTAPDTVKYDLCDTSTVCFDIDVIDPDDVVVDILVTSPGQFNPSDSSICFFADRDTTYEFTLIAIDTCGRSDTAYTTATVTFNDNPVITAPDSVKYSLCDTATVCFDINLYDPDDGLTITVSAPGQFNATDSSICFAADRDTTYEFTIVATDSCGKADTTYSTATVVFNQAPVVTAPDTVIYNTSDTSTVCFGITLYDPGDSLSVWVNPPGQYHYQDSSICLFADRDTIYDLTIIATDSCGRSDTAYTTVVVNYNQAPVITAPDTVRYNLCDTATVCFDIVLYDPDDGLTVTINPPGQFDPSDSSICFFADRDTTHNFTIIATDTTGLADTAYTTAVVNLNHPPVVTAPDTVKYNLCDTSTVCFDIILDDPDDGLLVWVSPPGEFDAFDSSICFFADRDTTYNFTIVVTDTCGGVDTVHTTAVIRYNDTPVVTTPDTVKYNPCDTATVCFDITLYDPDDGLTVSVNPPGQFNSSDSSICFLADRDTTYYFTIIVTDSCGKADTAYTAAVVSFNYPPLLTVPDDLETSLCQIQAICITDIIATDPDAGDTITLEKTGGPGVFSPITGLSPITAEICFTPSGVDSTYEFVFRVTNHCGAFDDKSFNVTVGVNQPPLVAVQTSIDTVELCPDAQFRLNVQGDDPNTNYDIDLHKKEGPGNFSPVSGKPLLSGFFSWTPTAADTIQIHRVIFEAIDHCGLTDQDTIWLRVKTPDECECLVDVYIDTVDCVFPGDVAEVSISLFSDLDIGGFNLYVAYDPTVLTFLDVERGDLIDDFDGYYDEYGHSPRYFFQYFNSRILPCGFPCASYKIKIVGIADMPDGRITGPLPADQGELIKLRFKVTNDANFQDLLLPIRFDFDYDIDSSSNSFSSATGESLYVNIDWPGETSNPNHNILRWGCFADGGVKVCNDAFAWVGDINLNEYPYEIADAVLFSNYFMSGPGVFHIDPEVQVLATDVNQDGYVLTISDFIFLIRIILEDISPKAKLAPSADLVDVTLTTQDDMVKVKSFSNSSTGAGLYVFKHSGEVKNLTMNTDMSVKYHDANGELRVLVYSLEGKAIPAGAVELFSFEAEDVELVEVEAADFYGSALKSTISNKVLPTRFALMNNYPNPFNLATNISFALPVNSQVNLKIYNIAGQLVKAFEEEYQAGAHTIVWDGTNTRGETVASGIYLYRLVAGKYSCTRKMVLMK